MNKPSPANKPQRGRGKDLDPFAVIKADSLQLKRLGLNLNDPVKVREQVSQLDNTLKGIAKLQAEVGKIRSELVGHEKTLRLNSPSKKKGRTKLKPGSVIDINGKPFILQNDNSLVEFVTVETTETKTTNERQFEEEKEP